MNQVLFESLTERFQLTSSFDVRSDPGAEARLREAAELGKIELSTNSTTHLSLPYIANVLGKAKHLALDLTRSELGRLVRPVVERCRAPVE